MFEQITNVVVQSILRVRFVGVQRVNSLGFAVADFATMFPFRSRTAFAKYVIGMIRMNQVMKICLGVALSVVTLVPVARADEFKLSNNQRISCSRGLSPGKLNTATCKSYAYLFNVKTSEYFRCQVSLALTRDNKEVINVQTDGGCTKGRASSIPIPTMRSTLPKPSRPTPIHFSGRAAIRFGRATSMRAKLRGCITISSGLGSDISKCLDMTSR